MHPLATALVIIGVIAFAVLSLFAFMSASKRSDQLSDDITDRLLHDDPWLADVLNSFHNRGDNA